MFTEVLGKMQSLNASLSHSKFSPSFPCLTEALWAVIELFMKAIILTIISCLPAFGQGGIIQVPPKQPVPQEVMLSAQKATQALMNKVVRGDFKALVDKGNPAWMKVAARPHGGVNQFKAKMLKQLKDAVAKGFVFQAAVAQQPMVGYEVNYKVKKEEKGYKEWMVFVPTVNDIIVNDQAANPPRLEKLRAHRFQIAIASKEDLAKNGVDAWTFISGAGIKGIELRKIYPFLPKDEKRLGFPPIRTVKRQGNQVDPKKGR